MNAAFPLMGNSGAAASAPSSKARVTADGSTTSSPDAGTLRMKITRINFYYGKNHALHNVSLDVATNRVTALIGPSGCGKSTLLRTLNRMHETLRHTRLEGEISLDGGEHSHSGCHEAAAPSGYGLPEAESVPQVHL